MLTEVLKSSCNCVRPYLTELTILLVKSRYAFSEPSFLLATSKHKSGVIFVPII